VAVDEVVELQDRLRSTTITEPHRPLSDRPLSAPPDVRRSGSEHHIDHRSDHREHRPHTSCREPVSNYVRQPSHLFILIKRAVAIFEWFFVNCPIHWI